MFCVCKSPLDTSFRSNDKHLLLKLLNSGAYEKYEYGHLGSWYMKSIPY